MRNYLHRQRSLQAQRWGRGSGTGMQWNQGGFSWVHRRWVWARQRSWGSMIRSTMGLSSVIRLMGPWVEDWIWASSAIALSILWLELGVSDESEWGEKFSEDGNGLKVKWKCKMIYTCGVGILQLTKMIFRLTKFSMRNQTHGRV